MPVFYISIEIWWKWLKTVADDSNLHATGAQIQKKKTIDDIEYTIKIKLLKQLEMG